MIKWNFQLNSMDQYRSYRCNTLPILIWILINGYRSLIQMSGRLIRPSMINSQMTGIVKWIIPYQIYTAKYQGILSYLVSIRNKSRKISPLKNYQNYGGLIWTRPKIQLMQHLINKSGSMKVACLDAFEQIYMNVDTSASVVPSYGFIPTPYFQRWNQLLDLPVVIFF